MSININLININYLISVAKVKTNNNNKNGPNKFKRTFIPNTSLNLLIIAMIYFYAQMLKGDKGDWS